jgi:hypothetical protein
MYGQAQLVFVLFGIERLMNMAAKLRRYRLGNGHVPSCVLLTSEPSHLGSLRINFDRGWISNDTMRRLCAALQTKISQHHNAQTIKAMSTFPTLQTIKYLFVLYSLS